MTNKLFLVMLIDEKRRKRGIKSGSTLGLLLILCYFISKYDLIILINEISCMDA
jgi:lipid-A-disaccharide synthase-like uncharacterized protein